MQCAAEQNKTADNLGFQMWAKEMAWQVKPMVEGQNQSSKLPSYLRWEP